MRSLSWIAAALLAFAAGAGAADTIAVQAGRVLTMTGVDLSPGVVVVRDGRITMVGSPEDVPSPDSIEWHIFPGHVLMPAFVEAHSQRGMRTENENLPNAAFVTAADQIDPVHSTLDDSLRTGVATLLVIPGNNTVFGGRGIVVKPVGIAVEEMARIGERGLKMSVAPRPGRTRMEQMGRLRAGLEAATRHLQEQKEKEAREGKRKKRASERDTVSLPWEAPGPDAPTPGTDPRKRALADLLEGRLFALAWCETAGDVAAAYRLADEFEFDLVPVLGAAAWRAAPLLAERKATAVLGPEMVHWERTPEGREEMHVLPLELWGAGVPFALTTDPTDFAAQYMTHQAAVAVRWGVPREDALAALTRIPARVAGLEEQLGTLETGKEATMVLLTGDPLSSRAWVDRVWIEGDLVYDRAEDDRLEHLLGKKAEKEE